MNSDRKDQNLGIAERVDVTIGPRSTKPIEVKTNCINAAKDAPSNVPVKVTPFVLEPCLKETDQVKLWTLLEY